MHITSYNASILAQAAPQQSFGEALFSMIPLLVMIFGIYYFVLARPMKKEQDEHKNMVNSLIVGDKVVTIGGALGQHADRQGRDARLAAGLGRLTRVEDQAELDLRRIATLGEDDLARAFQVAQSYKRESSERAARLKRLAAWRALRAPVGQVQEPPRTTLESPPNYFYYNLYHYLTNA